MTTPDLRRQARRLYLAVFDDWQGDPDNLQLVEQLAALGTAAQLDAVLDDGTRGSDAHMWRRWARQETVKIRERQPLPWET